jgi:predicted lipoprotein with Yx(FWY)xxD motif
MNVFIARSPPASTVRAMRRKRTTFLAPTLALPMIAVAIAGCGGGSSSNANANPSTTTTKQSTSTGSGAATVDVRSTGLGKILVDSKGMTLYLFEKDTGPKSTCSGACASAWPPFTTNGTPKAGSGATGSMIGTTKRSDGTTEVTYNGHPLYYYAGDQQPGDTNGQNLDQFGAEWYVVSPAGKTIKRATSMASTGTSSRGY